MRLFLLMLAVFLGWLTEPALSDTKRFRVKPDGDIRFDVPLDGPTRLSVSDDRIAKIIQSHSNFDMANDENTGDVFLRYVGVSASPELESGYLITEGGHTVSFSIQPRAGLDTQTVLITLVGVPSQSQREAAETNASGVEKPDGFLLSDGAASGRTGGIVTFVREAFAARIDTKQAGAKSSVSRMSYARGGFAAQIFRAKASASGAIPSAQNFYQGKKTLAVFVDEQISNGWVWVMVIGARQ